MDQIISPISKAQDQIQLLKGSVLTGYADTLVMVNSNSSNWTSGKVDESAPLQIQRMWAGIAINEQKFSDLLDRTEKVEVKVDEAVTLIGTKVSL